MQDECRKGDRVLMWLQHRMTDISQLNHSMQSVPDRCVVRACVLATG